MSDGLFSECFRQVLNWIYPRICEICGEGPLENASVCSSCLAALPRLPRPLCPACGGVVPGSSAEGNSCEACKEESREFDFARSALIYHGELRELIMAFKYRRGLHLANSFADLMELMMEDYADRLKGVSWVLVPVPLNRKKLMRRGFNQAEELAGCLSKRWNFPVVDALLRSCDRVSQTALDRKGRRRHVRDLYKASGSRRNHSEIEGRHVLLIDDLITTGSTANACAAILKRELHAASVGVLTLARAVPWELLPEGMKAGKMVRMD